MQSETDILEETVAELDEKYADISLANTVAGFKPSYYARKKNWPAFKDAVNAFIDADPSKIHPSQLNSFAWAIFENCDDPACVESALVWSKKSLEEMENAAFIDTYANLLHKLGRQRKRLNGQEKPLLQSRTWIKRTIRRP